MQRVDKCEECGGQFAQNKRGPRRRFCCPACRSRYNRRENYEKYKENTAMKAAGVLPEHKNARLEAKVKAAMAAGMSYGKYVAMLEMQKTEGKE